MYYDAEPLNDTRSARHIANEARKNARYLVQLATEARLGRNPSLYKLVNQQWQLVQADHEKLETIIHELPVESRPPFQDTRDQIGQWLEQYPKYPPEALDQERALSDVIERPRNPTSDEKAASIGNPGEEERSLNHNFPPPHPLPTFTHNQINPSQSTDGISTSESEESDNVSFVTTENDEIEHRSASESGVNQINESVGPLARSSGIDNPTVSATVARDRDTDNSDDSPSKSSSKKKKIEKAEKQRK